MAVSGPQHRDELTALACRAMRAHGLFAEFSKVVLREVDDIPHAAAARERGVRDLRDLLWISIDNDDSRDLDQLTVAEELPAGQVKILVAIADVDALVDKSSAIDQYAQHNTTSVYTAAAVFPMLPERLSTDLTSLAQDADRLAIVIEMLVGAQGTLLGSEVYRAWVRNRAKLAYNSVAAWLDGAAAPPEPVRALAGVAEQLRPQDRVAQAMRTQRHQHGALGLETLEPRVVFAGDELAGLRIETKNRAKELIEDFMIAANGVTARYLDEHSFPSLRRVLRAPARWPRIVELAAKYGEPLPAQPDSGALAQFLLHQRQRDARSFPELSLTVVKLLGAGEYVLERPGEGAPGHFGLAVRDYTHATAPNRRFPDLLTQRLLKAALTGQGVPYGEAQLSALAAHCTQMEDAANKVERQVRKSAAALLLQDRVGQRFSAIVTGASAKGTWVRILEPPVEGKVNQGFVGLDVGDRVQVELHSTDVERGFIDFSRVR